MKEKLEKFCLKCGSTSLKMAVTPWKPGVGHFCEYLCKDCGFEGMVLEGPKQFIESYKKALVKK